MPSMNSTMRRETRPHFSERNKVRTTEGEMKMQKTMLVGMSIASAVLCGCISPEEKMYREAIASYAQHIQPSDREQDVIKLEQSGSMGFGLAFVFLGDEEMALASKSERNTSSDTGFMISARKQAIHHLNRACDYYVRAQQSGQKCDASKKIKSAEETLKTAQVDLAALEAKKVNEDYISQGSSSFDMAKRQFAEAEKEIKTSKKIECVTRGLESLTRAVSSYEKDRFIFDSISVRKDSILGNYILKNPNMFQEYISYNDVVGAFNVSIFTGNEKMSNKLMGLFLGQKYGTRSELEKYCSDNVLDYIGKNR